MSSLVSIDFKSALNLQQYEAVTAPIGPALVLAGAGSGKTRTLTYRVAWLLSQGVAPWEILLLTFTNKSAKEMLERVETLTGISRTEFWGGTFHHIAQRVLRIHGEAVGIPKSFTILDASDAESLLGEVLREQDPSFIKNKDNPKARLIASIISYARNTRKALSQVIQENYPFLDKWIDKFAALQKIYQEKKLSLQVLDYDDLLDYWLKLLEVSPDALNYYQNRFKSILVDEYQDTNTLQSSIIDKLARDHQVMAVGDDAQCIYTWRGANLENILTFPHRHPGTKIFKIETNYRSTPEILSFANAALKNQTQEEGYLKELKAIRKNGPKPNFIVTADPQRQAQYIIRQIQALVGEGVRLSDIAILYRSHYHAMDLQMELSRQGISYVITSGVRFFEQAHIKDLVSQVRFAVNPNDSTSFSRFVCLIPKIGPRSAQKILTLAHTLAAKEQITIFKAFEHPSIVKKIPEVSREIWVDLVYTLQDMNENLNQLKPSELVKIALEGWYGAYMRNLYPNWQSRKDDLEGLEGFAMRFEDVYEMLAQLILLNSETSDRGIDFDENSLRLTTIHQAKGLEYPVVFVIGLAETLFPLKRAVEEGNVEEERRLFYVAVTRAMSELYLIHPKVNAIGNSQTLLETSRFIKEIPENNFETFKLSPSTYYYR